MNLKYLLSNKKKWLILLICILLFLFIAISVFHKDATVVDQTFYNFLSEHVISDSKTPYVKIITQLGGVIGLFVLTIIAVITMCVKKRKDIGLIIGINIGCASAINYLLKQVFQRQRPTGFRLIEEKGYSFPSGHSMSNMAFYGLLIYLICANFESKKLKIVSIFLLILLAISIGISRVYLGVHYISDVIGGFLLAICYLICFITFTNKIKDKRLNKLNKNEENENNEKIS